MPRSNLQINQKQLRFGFKWGFLFGKWRDAIGSFELQQLFSSLIWQGLLGVMS